MNIKTVSDFRKVVRNGKYAWPGGYPMYFITSDGDVLSFEVVKAERRNVLEAIRDNDHSGWRVVAVDVNWEDANFYCAHTGDRIESAYAEPEETT